MAYILIICLLILFSETPLHATQSPTIPLHKKPPITLTLDDAIAIALQNKPSLQQYKFVIEASKMKEKQALSGYLPAITINHGMAYQKGKNDLQIDTSLDANQLVYSFAGPIENYKKAQKATNIQTLTYDKDKKAIRHEVEKAFFTCWKLQQQQQAIKTLLSAARKTHEQAKHSNKLNLLDKKDWLKSSSDYANKLAIIENYFHDLEISQKSLEFFMGQPIDLTTTMLEQTKRHSQKLPHATPLILEWQTAQPYKLLPIKKYYTLAQKYRLEPKIADQSIAMARDDVYIANRSNLPTVKLHGATGYNGSGGVATTTTYHNIGAVVTWPIFNGLLNDFQAKEAHANMIKEALGKEQNIQQIQLDVETAYTELAKALNTLKAKKLDLLYKKNNLVLSKKQFEIGEISQVDYQTALSDWETSFFEWISVKADVAIKTKDLAFACGYPKEFTQ